MHSLIVVMRLTNIKLGAHHPGAAIEGVSVRSLVEISTKNIAELA